MSIKESQPYALWTENQLDEAHEVLFYPHLYRAEFWSHYFYRGSGCAIRWYRAHHVEIPKLMFAKTISESEEIILRIAWCPDLVKAIRSPLREALVMAFPGLPTA
jgi:hypothetical protein